ncbi:MAG: CRISPR-associated protein Cas5 [Victivallaceae bacterium]|nr:CRISPR-associated protein Cas5 [Victivallaceae bacterium]
MSSIVRFELAGDLALWRNVYDSMGSFSALGPSPSALAGLLGAALGFPSPRSQAAAGGDDAELKKQWRNGLFWPNSPQLLAWERDNDCRVACRWTGGRPRRIAWNVNGCKEISNPENLRMQQQLIEHPAYEVLVRLPEAEAARLMAALRRPAFRLYLGSSCCPAIVRVAEFGKEPESCAGWAFCSSLCSMGEVVPLSRHVVSPQPVERLRIDGFWVYPTPDIPGKIPADPFVRTWCE